MRDDISQRVTTSQGKLLIYIKTPKKEIHKKLPIYEIPYIWNEIVNIKMGDIFPKLTKLIQIKQFLKF